ncbi:MAG: helicase-related protein, partial [bacterium]
CVQKGVAFHHSGLVTKQRYLIEDAFKKGIIKAISSTPTLAAGLNLPAYQVIIKDYKRYSQRGMRDIPILEYHQMAGRAGRPGCEKVGKSVLCLNSKTQIDEIVSKYVFGKYEEVLSKLAVEPTLKMYLLSLIAMDMINSKEEIKKFFASTFYAHQYKDIESLNYNIFRIIELLKEYSFVVQDDDYYIATQLGKKVSELYLNPDTAYYFLENIEKFVNIFENDPNHKQIYYSLINFITNTIEMRPLFRVYKNEEEKYISKIEDIADSMVIKYDPFEIDYENFMHSLKTTDILMDWIEEIPEDFLCDKYNITPGELNYKVEVIDWLLYCLEELSYIKKHVYFKNLISKLRIRFKFGIKSELIPLVNLKFIGRVRARKLYSAGLKKMFDLKRVEFSQLSRIVGEKIAIKIKEQIAHINYNTNNENTVLTSQRIEKPQSLGKPKEIKIREVSDDEVDKLVDTYKQFEEENKDKNMNLTDYF